MSNKLTVVDLLGRDDYIEIPEAEFSLDKVLQIATKNSGCLVLSNPSITKLLSDKSFPERHDPASQYEVIKNGYVGALLVSDTDDFYEANERYCQLYTMSLIPELKNENSRFYPNKEESK